MRSAVLPSQSSGTRPRLPPRRRISSTHARTRARSRPTSVFVPCVDRDRTLGVLAHRQARHRERRRLLLDAARVGEHDARAPPSGRASRDSPADRQQRDRARRERGRKTEAVDVGPRARMHGPHQRNALRDVAQHARPPRRTPRDCRRSKADAASRRRSRQHRSTHVADRSRRARASSPAARRARWCASSESIITLPTKLHARRVDALAQRGCRRRRARSCRGCPRSGRSAARLISSGISRSKLRRPASTCATGIRFLLATRLHASVELTSPTTMTQLGFTSSTTGSKRRITSAVCTACVPEPTSRLRSGARQCRSANSRSFIARS